MKGFVPTPPPVVDDMVARLFADAPPSPEHLLLDPGCGEGEFVEGVLRWCQQHASPPPRLLGVEVHPGRAAEARSRFAGEPSVEIVEADFLEWAGPAADYVVGNPPYVPITQLTEREKARYREHFATASGRFDLYGLFFEQALRLLSENGRLVFITPEKYLSVGAAKPLRKMLAHRTVSEVVLLSEDTFSGLVTYPAVTVVDAVPSAEPTRVTLRDGSSRFVTFPKDGSSVNALIHGADKTASRLTLADVTRRISCGVATGADRVFVQPLDALPPHLQPYAYPTLAGRQLEPEAEPVPSDVMLVPYDRQGALLAPDHLGDLGAYLAEPSRKETLLRRTCVRRKPWYAFHETPPMADLLRPKLLCKDIAPEPHFWIDRAGTIVPRHSTYYIVPRDASHLDLLAEVLNSAATSKWLMAHAQPAANGYRRLQSSVLKRIPFPDALISRLVGPLEASRQDARQSALSLTS
ncbi:MAG: Eco57I restriction-modification methylase domain-containing protein [Rhodothermales bacterium]